MSDAVADRAALQATLAQLNVGALLMSLVHLTGDLSLLRGSIRRRFVNTLEQGAGTQPLIDGFTAADAELIRARALAVLCGERPAARMPAPETLDEMVAFIIGGAPARDAALLMRELAFEGPPPASPVAGAAQWPVIVIGAGQGGVAAAVRLAQLGVPYVVLEKNQAIGGTWQENSYPGIRVDVPGHTYSYSYAPNPDWTHYFPQGAEIRRYYEDVARQFGVFEHVRFGTTVQSADWDEAAACWRVRFRDASGEQQLTARAVVMAVGQLNQPRWPSIKDLDRYQGQLLHSAQWQPGANVAGRRVGLIGSGASAFQLVPELAKVASHLTVLQRSPAWMFPNAIYHAQVPEAQKWALRNLPYYSNWHRFTLLHTAFEGVHNETRVDPSWQQAGSVSASNDVLRQFMTQHIAAQVRDPELLQKLVPDYPPFGKRILQDEGSYLRALQEPHVSLVTEPIRHATATGITTADGAHHEFDVLVCATGFYADRFLWPMEIRGRGQVLLSQKWHETDARAYLGITMPEFPNLFCIYGPNTNWVVSGSIVVNAEYQASYVAACLAELIQRGQKSIECRQVVHDAYNAEIDDANRLTAWGVPQVANWYKNSAGRVTANMPLRPVDYWLRIKTPAFADFQFA